MFNAFIAALFEKLVGSLLRRLMGERILNMFKKVLAWLVFAALGGFSLYNLYWLIGSGTVFQVARGNRSGWIGFDDHPIAFVIWSLVYSLPVLVGALVVYSFFAERTAHRRAAFRQFTDGLGPPPMIRIIDGPSRPKKPDPDSKPEK